MARMKFICDAERCIECNGCVTACKNEHEVPWGVNRRRVVTLNDGVPGEKSISVACMHCSDDRVHPGHARKFTARLGELGQPVLLYQSDAGGHSGQGGDMRQLAAEVARVTVFLYQQLMDAA